VQKQADDKSRNSIDVMEQDMIMADDGCIGGREQPQNGDNDQVDIIDLLVLKVGVGGQGADDQDEGYEEHK